jgi:hypothetical protein
VADVPPVPASYAEFVFSLQTASALASATAPLISSFGDELTLWRDGNVVHWSYDGQTVIVAQQADGAVAASFVDVPTVDAISGAQASAEYRRSIDRRYQLTLDGCRAMVADMTAFFSGEREPFFTFVGARLLDA